MPASDVAPRCCAGYSRVPLPGTGDDEWPLDAQFTCFTGTKVHILTAEELGQVTMSGLDALLALAAAVNELQVLDVDVGVGVCACGWIWGWGWGCGCVLMEMNVSILTLALSRRLE